MRSIILSFLPYLQMKKYPSHLTAGHQPSYKRLWRSQVTLLIGIGVTVRSFLALRRYGMVIDPLSILQAPTPARCGRSLGDRILMRFVPVYVHSSPGDPLLLLLRISHALQCPLESRLVPAHVSEPCLLVCAGSCILCGSPAWIFPWSGIMAKSSQASNLHTSIKAN